MLFLKAIIKLYLIRRNFPLSVIYSGTNISSDCILENKSVIFSNVTIINTTVGAHSYIQKNSVITSTTIGKYCSIASNVNIGIADHPMHFVSTSPVFYDSQQPLPEFFVTSKNHSNTEPTTVIGSDVWIGQNVIIKSGVNIGTGAVVGAGAVVVKDVEPYSVVVGVPAKHLKWRFSEKVRDEMLLSKWWELPEENIKKYHSYFSTPESFIQKLKENAYMGRVGK